MNADELVRALILRRFTERFERLPYSAGFHVLHCESLDVADVSNQGGVLDMCGTCEHVAFRARVGCEHSTGSPRRPCGRPSIRRRSTAMAMTSGDLQPTTLGPSDEPQNSGAVVAVTATGALGHHGTMAAVCPGEEGAA